MHTGKREKYAEEKEIKSKPAKDEMEMKQLEQEGYEISGYRVRRIMRENGMYSKDYVKHALSNAIAKNGTK